jgi:hypothetical protein
VSDRGDATFGAVEPIESATVRPAGGAAAGTDATGSDRVGAGASGGVATLGGVTSDGFIPRYTANTAMLAASAPIHHIRCGPLRPAAAATGVACFGGNGVAGSAAAAAAAVTCTRQTARRPRHVHTTSLNPGPTAVTNPSRDTSATPGLLLCHSTEVPSVA